MNEPLRRHSYLRWSYAILMGLIFLIGASGWPGDVDAYTDADYAALVSEIQGHVAYFTSIGGSEAATLWKRVLGRIQGGNNISDAELAKWLADARRYGWRRGKTTLPKVIARLAQTGGRAVDPPVVPQVQTQQISTSPGDVDAYTDAEYAALVSEIQGHVAYFTSIGGSEAATLWKRVLGRIQGGNNISDAELAKWLADARRYGWRRGKTTLPKVIARLAQTGGRAVDPPVVPQVQTQQISTSPGDVDAYTDAEYAALVSEIQGHVAYFTSIGGSEAATLWKRVLGRIQGGNNISDAELAKWLADAHRYGWRRGKTTLPKVIARLAQTGQRAVEPPVVWQVQAQQMQLFSHNCGNGITVREDANGVHVITYPEGAAYTVCNLDNFITRTYSRQVHVDIPNINGELFRFLTWNVSETIRLVFGNVAETAIGYSDDVHTGNLKSAVMSIGGKKFQWVMQDDEPAPSTTTTLSFTSSAQEVSESTGASVGPILQLDPVIGTSFQVHFLVSGNAKRGAYQNGSCAGGDYCLQSPLAVPADVSTVRPRMHVVNDAKHQGDRSVSVVIDKTRLPAGITVGAINTLAVTITDDDPVPQADRRTAKQCVEANLGRGEGCGPGGHQVMIERETQGPVAEGGTIRYYLYPSFPPMSGSVKVFYELSDRHTGKEPRKTVGVTSVLDPIAIPKEGLAYDLVLPQDGLSKEDSDVTIQWKVFGGTNYQVHPDSMTDRIRVIDDDPLTWYWVDDDLGQGPSEGGGIRTGKIAFDNRKGLPKDQPTNVLGIDLNVTGCALVSEPPAADSTPVGADADIPCWVNIKYNQKPAYRQSNDEFQIRQFLTVVTVANTATLARSLLVELKVGQDADTSDETITMNPVLTFNNSSGGVEEQTGGGFPATFTVYDDDDEPMPDEGGLDSVYMLGTALPTTPTGGTGDETHVPEGWSRSQLAPTGTEHVYRSQRSRTYDSNDVFISAGAWGAPVKVADAVPTEVTISFSKATYAVNEGNGPGQPVLVVTGTTTRDYHIPYTLVAGTAKEGEDYEGAAGQTALIPAGHTNGRFHFDIHEIDDTVQEEDETFSVELGPFPPGTQGGTDTTATYTIFDDEPVPPKTLEETLTDETPDGTVRLLGLTADAVDEASTLSFTLRLWSKSAYNGPVVVLIQNVNAAYSRLTTPYEHTFPELTLPAGQEVQTTVSVSDLVINEGDPTEKVDEPNGRLAFKLVAQDAVPPSEGEEGTPGYDINEDDIHQVTIRDKEKTSLNLYVLTTTQSNDSVEGDNADFVVELRKLNTNVPNRELVDGEIIEFPVRVYKTGKNQYVRGELLDPSRYEITAFQQQSNVTVRKIEDGYKVKVTGTSTRNVSPCTRNSDASFKRARACLNFHGNLALDDPDWSDNVGGDNHEQNLLILAETEDAWFGDTNVNPGIKAPKNNDYTTTLIRGHINVKRLRDDATNPFFRLVPVDGTVSVTEPDTGYAWLPFDVTASVAPSGATGIAFCTDPGGTTASYYRDYTIYGEGEYELVQSQPEYGRWVTGYAWRPNQNCSRSFSIRDRSTRFYIRVLPDSHDEGAEPIRLRVEQRDPRPDGNITTSNAVTFTIVNDGPIPAAWLARFGRTVAQQALDGIAGRLAAPRTPGAEGTLAGQPLNLQLLGGKGTPENAGPGNTVLERLAALVLPGLTRESTGEAAWGGLPDRPAGRAGAGGMPTLALTLRDVLRGSSFTATSQPDAHGGNFAFWGRAAQANFDGREEALSLNGEATTGLLGVDYARDRWLVGVSLLQSAGTGGYADTAPFHDGDERDGTGSVETTLTAAVPYVSLQAAERLKLWGAAGYGRGEVRLETGMGEALRTDVSWSMATLGLRGQVLAPPPAGSGPALAVTSDALWAGTDSEKIRGLEASDSDVTRLRLGLEGSWPVLLETLGQFTPTLAVGARHDGGDAETGFGVELGGGLAWMAPQFGLALNLDGRTLLTHRDDDFKDQGMAASFTFDPDPATPRGPSVTLRQDWGSQATGGLDALFASDPLTQRPGTTATSSRWAAEAAWGFPAFGGRFTGSPHVGLGLTAGTRDYRLGWRLMPATLASALSLNLQATRRELDAAQPEHSVEFEFTTRW